MTKRYALVWTLALAMAPAAFAADQSADTSGQSSQGQSQQGQNQSSRSPDQTNATNAQTAGAQQQGTGQAASQESTKEFVQNLASTNQFEIQAGQFIQQHAQDQQIKDYAQKMIDDHQKAADQLKSIAEKIGADVSSQQLNAVHQAKLAELQKKQGEDLEKCYIFGQAGMHLTDVLAVKYQSQNASDPQLKQFLTQLEPKLRHHLQEAIQLSGGDMARMASERMEGGHMRHGEKGASVSGDATGQGQSGQLNSTGGSNSSSGTGSSGVSGQSSGGTSGASGTSGSSSGAGTSGGTGTQNP
jgi:putative membrane protein